MEAKTLNKASESFKYISSTNKAETVITMEVSRLYADFTTNIPPEFYTFFIIQSVGFGCEYQEELL